MKIRLITKTVGKITVLQDWNEKDNVKYEHYNTDRTHDKWYLSNIKRSGVIYMGDNIKFNEYYKSLK